MHFLLCVLVLLPNGKNTEYLGDHSFTQGEYVHALEYYYEAYDSPIVFVKRARTLSILRDQGLVCDYDAYVSVILEYLCWAVEQDSSVLSLIIEDTCFYEISHTVLFRSWQGHEPENDSGLASLLPRVRWYNYVESITAVGGQMVFHDDGAVYVDWGTYYGYDEETGEFIAYPQEQQTGHFVVKEGYVDILWDDKSKSVYRLDMRGTCGVLIDVDTGQDVVFDQPDECNT